MTSNATLSVYSNHQEFQYPVNWYKNHFLEGHKLATIIREDERFDLHKIKMFVRIDHFPAAKSEVEFSEDANDLITSQDLEEIWTDF